METLTNTGHDSNNNAIVVDNLLAENGEAGAVAAFAAVETPTTITQNDEMLGIGEQLHGDDQQQEQITEGPMEMETPNGNIDRTENNNNNNDNDSDTDSTNDPDGNVNGQPVEVIDPEVPQQQQQRCEDESNSTDITVFGCNNDLPTTSSADDPPTTSAKKSPRQSQFELPLEKIINLRIFKGCQLNGNSQQEPPQQQASGREAVITNQRQGSAQLSETVGEPNDSMECGNIVNSTSLEDVELSQMSDNRAQSIQSLHSVVETPEAEVGDDDEEEEDEANLSFEELERRLEESNRNIRSMQVEQQKLLRMHIDAQQNLSRLEELRAEQLGGAENGGVPLYTSIEDMQQDISTLVGRMNSLSEFVRRQNDLSSMLGDNGPEMLAEQELLSRRVANLQAQRHEISHMVGQLNELSDEAQESAQHALQRADQMDGEASSSEDRATPTPQAARVVPIQLSDTSTTLTGSAHASRSPSAGGGMQVTHVDHIQRQLVRIKQMLDSITRMEENLDRETSDINASRRLSRASGSRDSTPVAVEPEYLRRRMQVLDAIATDLENQSRQFQVERDQILHLKIDVEDCKEKAATAAKLGEDAIRRCSPNRESAERARERQRQLEQEQERATYEERKRQFERMCENMTCQIPEPRAQAQPQLVGASHETSHDSTLRSTTSASTSVFDEDNGTPYEARRYRRHDSADYRAKLMNQPSPVPAAPQAIAANMPAGARALSSLDESGGSAMPQPMAPLNTATYWRPNIGAPCTTNAYRVVPIAMPEDSAPQYHSIAMGIQTAAGGGPEGQSHAAVGNGGGGQARDCSCPGPSQAHGGGHELPASLLIAGGAASTLTAAQLAADPLMFQQFVQTQQMLINSVSQCNHTIWQHQREIEALKSQIAKLQERLNGCGAAATVPGYRPDLPAAMGAGYRGESVPPSLNSQFAAMNTAAFAMGGAEGRAQSEQPLHMLQSQATNAVHQHLQQLHQQQQQQHHQYHQHNSAFANYQNLQYSAAGTPRMQYQFGNFGYAETQQQQQQVVRPPTPSTAPAPTFAAPPSQVLANQVIPTPPPPPMQQQQQQQQQQQFVQLNNALTVPQPPTQPAPTASGEQLFNNETTAQSPHGSNGPGPIFMHHHNNSIYSNNSNLRTQNQYANNLQQQQQIQQQQLEQQQQQQQLQQQQEQLNHNLNNTLNNQVAPGNRANNYWDNFRSYSRQNLLSTNSSKSNEEQQQQQQLERQQAMPYAAHPHLVDQGNRTPVPQPQQPQSPPPPLSPPPADQHAEERDPQSASVHEQRERPAAMHGRGSSLSDGRRRGHKFRGNRRSNLKHNEWNLNGSSSGCGGTSNHNNHNNHSNFMRQPLLGGGAGGGGGGAGRPNEREFGRYIGVGGAFRDRDAMFPNGAGGGGSSRNANENLNAGESLAPALLRHPDFMNVNFGNSPSNQLDKVPAKSTYRSAQPSSSPPASGHGPSGSGSGAHNNNAMPLTRIRNHINGGPIVEEPPQRDEVVFDDWLEARRHTHQAQGQRYAERNVSQPRLGNLTPHSRRLGDADNDDEEEEEEENQFAGMRLGRRHDNQHDGDADVEDADAEEENEQDNDMSGAVEEEEDEEEGDASNTTNTSNEQPLDPRRVMLVPQQFYETLRTDVMRQVETMFRDHHHFLALGDAQRMATSERRPTPAADRNEVNSLYGRGGGADERAGHNAEPPPRKSFFNSMNNVRRLEAEPNWEAGDPVLPIRHRNVLTPPETRRHEPADSVEVARERKEDTNRNNDQQPPSYGENETPQPADSAEEPYRQHHPQQGHESDDEQLEGACGGHNENRNNVDQMRGGNGEPSTFSDVIDCIIGRLFNPNGPDSLVTDALLAEVAHVTVETLHNSPVRFSLQPVPELSTMQLYGQLKNTRLPPFRHSFAVWYRNYLQEMFFKPADSEEQASSYSEQSKNPTHGPAESDAGSQAGARSTNSLVRSSPMPDGPSEAPPYERQPGNGPTGVARGGAGRGGGRRMGRRSGGGGGGVGGRRGGGSGTASGSGGDGRQSAEDEKKPNGNNGGGKARSNRGGGGGHKNHRKRGNRRN